MHKIHVAITLVDSVQVSGSLTFTQCNPQQATRIRNQGLNVAMPTVLLCADVMVIAYCLTQCNLLRFPQAIKLHINHYLYQNHSVRG